MTRRDHFKRFDHHTLVKHFLLDSYVKGWAAILLGTAAHPGRFRRIVFVDAFAGAGGDEQGRPGSPVIASEIARDANARRFPTGVSGADGMRVLAFETDVVINGRLVERMAPFTTCKPWIAQVRDFSLDTRLDAVMGYLKRAPSLFFIDPFGVDGLSARVVERILAGTHNEIFVLFCDEAAIRLAGKARIGQVDRIGLIKDAEQRAESEGSLFGEEDVLRRRNAARKKAQRVAAGHKSNADAKRILDTAFGADWWQSPLERTPSEKRAEKAAALYEELLRSYGAKYVLQFEVTTERGRRKYLLMHASRNKRAHAAMKFAMHRTMRRQASSAGASGLLAEFNAVSDLAPILTQISTEFAGRRVRWTSADKDEACVRRFALDETQLWVHECPRLKEGLAQFAMRSANGKIARPLTYEFPLGLER